VTNSSTDVSVDHYRHSVIPVMRQFGLYDKDDYKFEIKVNKRGSAPLGGGEVFFSMPNPKKLRACVSLGNFYPFFLAMKTDFQMSER
jgi:RNA 3'-terminal phosphate cyclase-like protein